MQDMDSIYREHASTVFKYLMTLTKNQNLAEELTQETFYKAVYSIDNYDGSSKMTTWLCGIAKNMWYQGLDRMKKAPHQERDHSIPTADLSVDDQLMNKEDKIAFYKLVRKLEEPTREVIYLRLSGELSFGEIGAILGKSENWARVTFYRGKMKLIKEAGMNEQI